MRYNYSRARQGIYAVGVVMMVSFGLFLMYIGYDSMGSSSASVPRGSSRRVMKMARQADSFTTIVMICGAVCAILALKPGQVLYASTKAYVELDEGGLTYEGIDKSARVTWSEVRKASLDELTGLELKVGKDYLVIPKEFESWDELVSQVQARVPKT